MSRLTRSFDRLLPGVRGESRRWWLRFRLSRGLAGLHRKAVVAEERIGERACDPAVESAAALTAGACSRPRLWRAHPPRRIDRPLAVLDDLCIPGASGWQPWRAAAAPYDSARLDFVRLADALVFVRSGLLMPAPFVALRETHPGWGSLLEPLPGTTRVANEAPLLALGAARPRRIVGGPVLSLCHAYSRSYGHWLLDCLPALLALLGEVAARQLGILLPPLLPWQRRSLELLGVPEAAIVEAPDETVACSDVVGHSFGGNRHALASGPLLEAAFRRLVGAAARDGDAPTPRLVYLSRRRLGSWRAFASEAAVEAALARMGFAVAHPEEMTLDQQITLVSRAEVIVGPHGSALVNAGFAPAGCLIVAIVPEHMSHQAVYGPARHRGHNVVILVAARDPPAEADATTTAGGFFMPHRYDIAADMVVERVGAAMARLGIRPALATV